MSSTGPRRPNSPISFCRPPLSLEREDIGSGGHDGFMIAMSAQIPPVGEARDDYAIFCDLAGRLGFGEAFSEGRDAGQWLRHLYEESRPRAQEEGIALPSVR